MSHYLETESTSGKKLLIKLNSIKIIEKVNDYAQIDGIIVTTKYEELKEILGADPYRYIIDWKTDFRIRQLTRESIYRWAKEFGTEKTLAYIKAIVTANTELDITEAKELLLPNSISF